MEILIKSLKELRTILATISEYAAHHNHQETLTMVKTMKITKSESIQIQKSRFVDHSHYTTDRDANGVLMFESVVTAGFYSLGEASFLCKGTVVCAKEQLICSSNLMVVVVAKAEAETETIVTDEYLFQHPLIAQRVQKSPLM